MEPEFLAPVLGALISLVAGGLASSDEIRKLARYLLKIKEPLSRTYSERISALAEDLKNSSRQVDEVLEEISRVALEHEKSVRDLEGKLGELEAKEKNLKDRIESLQKVPLDALEHFKQIMDSGDQKSKKRDYFLFLAGVVVSTILAIVLKLLGLG